MKRIFYIFSSICLWLQVMVVGASCRKFVDIPPAKNQLSTATVFSDSADATSAVLGIYEKAVTRYIIQQGETVCTGLSGDELQPNNLIYYPDDMQFYMDAINPTNTTNRGLWLDGYSILYQANACIENLQASARLTTSCKNQLTGEAKFMRALVFFHLTNLFGDIPLVTSTSYTTNGILPKAPAEQVYQQMITDLTDAQNLLAPAYPGTGKVRANAYTASALLARVYLYHKQWADAEAAASAVINCGLYSLEDNLNNVFLANGRETIMQLMPVGPSAETPEGTLFIPSSPDDVPTYSINNYLLNAFEPNDLRKSSWLASNTVNGATYYYPFKYQFRTDNQAKNYYVLLRLAEQYLIRAEARAQQGGSKITDAITDLNVIRSRAGLLPTTAGVQADVLSAIYHERQVELFVESGHRWYDLKRTGQIDGVMGGGGVCAAKGGIWKHNRALYPVPFSELQLDQFLTQSPGY